MNTDDLSPVVRLTTVGLVALVQLGSLCFDAGMHGGRGASRGLLVAGLICVLGIAGALVFNLRSEAAVVEVAAGDLRAWEARGERAARRRGGPRPRARSSRIPPSSR